MTMWSRTWTSRSRPAARTSAVRWRSSGLGVGSPDGDAALDTTRRFVDIAQDYPLMPAFKALLAHLTGDDAWVAVRPPLAPLPAADRNALLDRLRRASIISR